MKDIQLKFGENVKNQRKNMGYSREKLAEISGLHWTYIGSVERWERNISIQNIKKIADALNVKISDLFVGINAKKTSNKSKLKKTVKQKKGHIYSLSEAPIEESMFLLMNNCLHSFR